MEKLTNAQNSIWITEQYYKGSSVNNICGTAFIHDKVDFEKLKKSIEIVCNKHDNFWLIFCINDGEVLQELSKRDKVNIGVIDVSTKEQLEEKRNEIVRTKFQLENSKLFKFYIFKFPDGKAAFMLNIHHLISDAWTLALICNEIVKTYSALIHDEKVETKAIYSYIDYIKSEKEYQKSEKYLKDKSYWEENFKTIPETAILQGSVKDNANITSYEGERLQYSLSNENVAKIKNYSKENKISLYNFFMSIYGIYISEMTNLDEFVIGTPILNRTNYKEKSTPGMFVNIAPLKINVDEKLEFKEFVRKVSRNSMDMLKHQKYSYQCLLEELRNKDKNIPNLYSILLSYQITNAKQDVNTVEYETDWTFNGSCADNIDIQIYDLNDTGSLNIAYDYKSSIYNEKDIEGIHNRILNIINQVINNENIKLNEIKIVTQEEKNKLIVDFNNTDLKYDKNVPFIKYFEEQVKNNPKDIAIVFEDKKLTYKELNEKANSLANLLRKNGVKNNSIVGILQERSFEMVISILAVLKSGGCYIPIALDYPADRVEYMLKDSGATILLTDKESEFKTEKKVINVKDPKIYSFDVNNIENISKPEDLAYIIYTSGSTGTPKGVMLKQQNLSNFYVSMKNIIKYLKDENKHKILSITTVSFDIFAFEMLISLAGGLTVCLTNENEQKLTVEIEKIIEKNNVEIIQTTPSIMKFHLDNIGDKNNLKSLKYVMLAGEPLPKMLVDRIKKEIPGVTIYNGYGPSETTIFSTVADVTNREDIVIGKPINNTQIYILNKNKKLLPPGTVGELYISGDGVGKGYINKPEQTRENFIVDPYISGNIMYKVGDLGSYNENGEINCYGRIDNQVKLRGLRIELSEIEKQIQLFKNVTNSVVMKRNINKKDILVAYYVAKNEVDKLELKKYLHSKLPEYMIPQHFVQLEAMPHTPNGKIDRKQLPEPTFENKTEEIEEARNEIDTELIKILKKMLQIDRIGINETLLELGGDSLTAITLSTKILSKYNVQINVRDILSNYTIKDISDYITENKSNSVQQIGIKKAPMQETYPLSSAQRRIYYNVKMIGDENIVYNMPGALLVDKILDENKVKRAFNKILERHSILRTNFVVKNGNVEQKINAVCDIDIPVFYNKECDISKILEGFSKPFNLENDLLIRIELHYINKEKTLILMDSHHIVMDGTSLNNFITEFERLYNEENLKVIPIQYKDYSVWEEKYNNSTEIEGAEEYWINKFKDSDLEQLNLPYDYKITANRSYKGNKILNVIDEEKFNKIEKYAKDMGMSPYMFFISVFYILLYKYTGQTEITLGSPIANRQKNELKRMIGMFVNNIVTKANINPCDTFYEFMNSMKNQILDDLSHQPYSYDMLVKKLGIKADNSRNPLFDVMFTYQNNEQCLLKFGDDEAKIIEINNGISKFNLSLEIKPKMHTISIEYCTTLFKKSTIERILNHYMNAIESVMENINVKIKDINIISEEEKNKILYDFNNTKLEYPDEKIIAELFEEQVEKTPNNIAVVWGEHKITYSELNEKANQVATYLRNEKNIKPNDMVGVMLPRNIELISTLIGVLKSGACYIPIDPSYPEKRIEYMLENSNAKVLLTNRELCTKMNFENAVCVDYNDSEIYSRPKGNLQKISKSNNLAYVIYTSGSTGNPKGVKITNRNLCNFIYAMKEKIDFNSEKTMLSVTTISFDIFGLEIWVTLTSGMKLVLANEEEQHMPELLNKLCIKNSVDMIQTTPSRYLLMLEESNNLEFFRNFKEILIGGENVSENVVEKIKKVSNAKIYDVYGPTETTIWSTMKEITNDNVIDIGKPIANTQVYVLDDELKVLPIGVEGELYIAGDGVGDGYLNREDLTKERYITNPYIPNSIMYRTGDACKFDENGELRYFGRKDGQIKVRGLRIELSGIEKKILEYKGIEKATVVKQNIGEREIISAYFIANKRIRVSELREYLSKYLPNYMIPSYFLALDTFPYTPNGKIDKKKLPIPNGVLKAETKEYVKPRTELEIKIVKIWEEILNTKPIGIKENFFELGGDSILAMNLNIKLLAITDKIKYADIFAYPTVEKLVEKIEKDEKHEVKNYEDLNEKYKDILNKNMNIPNDKTENNLGNVLLIGATGYLGIHILETLLNGECEKIYLIIRKEPGMTIEQKLVNKLHYYFGEKYDKYIGNKIIILHGDMTSDGFGLPEDRLEEIGNSVSTVINSAAKVAHYGNYADFYKANVMSVEKIIDFAKRFKIKIFHISTLSVSGNAFFEQYYLEQGFEKEKIFSENNFYIGQNLENVYVRTKFEAEQKILNSILDGMDAYVLRVGNLMPRYSDGKFQDNINENAYLNRLKALMELGCIPEELLNGYLEFSPIDSTAMAIYKILKCTNTENRIYHLFNHNHVEAKEIIDDIAHFGIDMEIVKNNEFKEKIKTEMKEKNSDIINMLLNDMDKDMNLHYNNNIKVDSKHTIKLLELYGFVWPKIDIKYIANILKLLKGE